MSSKMSSSELDLTGKSNEEVDSIKTELTKRKYELGIEIRKINYDIKLVEEEVEKRKVAEYAKLILSSEISSIEGLELLREDELSIIIKKMDRTYYGSHYPRLRDLERICKEVIRMKKQYPKWTLINLSNGGQQDSIPPYIFYRYEYKDECGNCFDIGGLKL